MLTVVVSIGSKQLDHSSGGGDVHLELWQAINLIGAPMLALIFAQPVIDDVKAWWAAKRTTHPDDA